MSTPFNEPRRPGHSRRLRGICATVLLVVAAPLAGQAADSSAPKPGTTRPTVTTPLGAATPQPGSSVSPTATPDTMRRRADSLRIVALQDSLEEARKQLEKPGGWGEFPGSPATAVLAVILLGALGALAGDLVVDGGRLDRWKRDDTGWLLGFPGRLVIGVVTALIVVLGLNPPEGSWPVLMSTALAGGAASEAVLLSVMASWKARMAEREKERVITNAATTLEGARADVRAVTTAAPPSRAGVAAEAFAAPVEPNVGEQIDQILARAQANVLAQSGERNNP